MANKDCVTSIYRKKLGAQAPSGLLKQTVQGGDGQAYCFHGPFYGPWTLQRSAITLSAFTFATWVFRHLTFTASGLTGHFQDTFAGHELLSHHWVAWCFLRNLYEIVESMKKIENLSSPAVQKLKKGYNVLTRSREKNQGVKFFVALPSL